MTSVAGDFYDFIVADDKQAGLCLSPTCRDTAFRPRSSHRW